MLCPSSALCSLPSLRAHTAPQALQSIIEGCRWPSSNPNFVSETSPIIFSPRRRGPPVAILLATILWGAFVLKTGKKMRSPQGAGQRRGVNSLGNGGSVLQTQVEDSLGVFSLRRALAIFIFGLSGFGDQPVQSKGCPPPPTSWPRWHVRERQQLGAPRAQLPIAKEVLGIPILEPHGYGAACFLGLGWEGRPFQPQT